MTDNKTNKILITSALPYVNNVPHLGNIIGCVLSADVYARYKRNCGSDVLYVCGTDEYGTTTEIKAKQEGLSCQEICDKYHNLHKDIYDWFNISFDIFGRTTTDTHTQMTHEIFTDLYTNGHIEEKTVSQHYCSDCKMFLADRYVLGECYHKECKGKKNITKCDQCDFCDNLIETEKIINPSCATCKKTPEIKDSDHLHIKLGNFQDNLKKYFNNNIFLTKNARCITKTWLSKNLHSRCITRDLEWGTPVPTLGGRLEKFNGKVFYVWFDAPIGYYSILKHGLKEQGKEDECDKWLNSDTELVQFMAKDNVPFHTIVFPATLMGIGGNKYPVVNKLSSTEYLNYESSKFSKSNNIGVFGDDAKIISDDIDISEDYWRYYLLKNRPETRDVSFSWKQFMLLCNADLVKNYGNLANRCISMTRKYTTGNLNINLNNKYNEYKFYIDEILDLSSKYNKHMDVFELKEALACAFKMSSVGNRFLQAEQPWVSFAKYAKDKYNTTRSEEENKQLLTKTRDILSFGIWIVYWVSVYLKPFIPKSAEYIINHINCDNQINTSIYEDFLKCINNTGTLNVNLLETKYKMPFKPMTESDIVNAITKTNISCAVFDE